MYVVKKDEVTSHFKKKMQAKNIDVMGEQLVFLFNVPEGAILYW